MEVENVSISVPKSTINNAEVSKSRILGTPRICPLCESQIKRFFINFNEKMLMCENTECEFPFGYEDLQFIEVDDCDNETGTVQIRQTIYPRANSCKSLSSMSDIEELYNMSKSECSQRGNQLQIRRPLKTYQRNKERFGADKEITQGVKDISMLSAKMVELDSPVLIKNKKIIKSLFNLQGASGVKLLKKNELDKIVHENKKPEVKIDIEKHSDISVIKIELVDMKKSDNSTNKRSSSENTIAQ
ncbi:unnamed protein product [Leptidea sinapis]|uniref:Uncharacterized protein n=1 Tax=Leptidea sinapis TaxID=189913 RepID=A0A5E4QIQ6_9NEOP|nr:unnamed protein product [Leptidea sinapis]